MYEGIVDSKARVLVVDDESMQRGMISEALVRSGFEVDSTGDFEKAKRLIKARPYEVLVCDIRLGNYSGLDLARFAKALDQTQEVIIITGYASVETAQEAIRVETFDYLTKPLDLGELTSVVERAVMRSKAARQSQKALNDLIDSGRISPITLRSKPLTEDEAKITHMDSSGRFTSRLSFINSKLQSLQKLWDLKSQGAITDEEYGRLKEEILDEST